MDRPSIFKVLLTSVFISLSPVFVLASPSLTTVHHSSKDMSTGTDSQQLQDKKKDKGERKPDLKQQPDQPGIREVPKARKQSRPPIVVKPKIKAKPVKVIRPKIKRP